MFPHLLREESIKIGIEASNVPDALQQIIDHLPAWGIAAKDKKQLLEAILQREKFGTTAIGEGIALPHCIFPGVSIPLASLGISREGIPFPSLDGKPVHLIFMSVVPETEDALQMKQRLLHDAEVFFRDRFICERIRIAENPEEIYEMMLRESNYKPEISQAVRFGALAS